MKLLIGLVGFALMASAQTRISPGQLLCFSGPITSMNTNFTFVAPLCVQLDPAAFALDTTTKPPTLRSTALQNVGQSMVGVVPAGTVDGVNALFTIADQVGSGTISVYRNGLRQMLGVDYQLGQTATSTPTAFVTTITFMAVSIPQVGDLIQADYRR